MYLRRYGWYRIDARGNKSGVEAMFCPPQEKLAFPIREQEERDFPEIWPEPLPVIVDVLMSCTTIEEVAEKLPDVAVIATMTAC